MPRWRTRRSERGYTLTELLVLIALITVLSLWGLPRALEPRLRLNETSAVELLRVLQSGRLAWEQQTGVPVTLVQLTGYLLPDEEAELPRSLMPHGFFLRDDGAVLRGGYRFRESYDRSAGPLGCWAWPKLREYSGREVYWLDYATGEVFRVDGLEALPPPTAPAEGSLLPLRD